MSVQLEQSARISALLDRVAIIDCMARYTRGVDRHDCQLMRDTFWPEAEISYTNLFQGDAEQFIAWVNTHHDAEYRNHQHHTTTHTVTIQGDQATAEHYCLVFLQRHDGDTLISSGRYLQQYERRNGEWRILIREYMPEMGFNLPGRNAGDGVSDEALRKMYEGAGSSEGAGGAWAPVPPSGTSHQDRSDLSYCVPLTTRSERMHLHAWRKLA